MLAALNLLLLGVGEKAFVTFSARKWLFDGVKDFLLDLPPAFRPKDIKLPPFKKFSWFYAVSSSSY